MKNRRLRFRTIVNRDSTAKNRSILGDTINDELEDDGEALRYATSTAIAAFVQFDIFLSLSSLFLYKIKNMEWCSVAAASLFIIYR